jgi:hypothetical protein
MRQEDILSPGVQGQVGQHSEIHLNRKKKKKSSTYEKNRIYIQYNYDFKTGRQLEGNIKCYTKSWTGSLVVAYMHA